MKLEHRCLAPANLATTWNLLLDLPRIAACVPGLEGLTADGEDRFAGTLRAQAGPMRVNLSGSVKILERDAAKGEAKLLLEAADRRLGGSVRTNMILRLLDKGDGGTELVIVSDTAFGGRLAALGQPIIRRKAADTVAEFAQNLAALVGEEG